MKKIFLFTISLLLCSGLFAKEVKIDQGRLANQNYVLKLADKLGLTAYDPVYDVKMYNNDYCYAGRNQETGAFIFFYTVVYKDGRFTYSFVKNDGKFYSLTVFAEKVVDNPMTVKLKEDQNLLNYTESSGVYLNELGIKYYTALLAYLRAECLVNYKEATNELEAKYQQRNDEIMQAGFNGEEAELDKTLEILKKYNQQ